MKSKLIFVALVAGGSLLALWALNNVAFVQKFVAPKPTTGG